MFKVTAGIIAIIIAALLALMVVCVGGYVISVRNKAASLEVQFKAQVSANQSTYDKMWKSVIEKAGVTKQYANDFKENYAAIMENRYGNPDNRSNSMMLWIQEKNPDFDASLYKDISRTIEAGRVEFDISQKKMIDIKMQHDQLLTQFPSSLAMFGKTELVLKLVTSDRTEKAFESGRDSAINPFGR